MAFSLPLYGGLLDAENGMIVVSPLTKFELRRRGEYKRHIMPLDHYVSQVHLKKFYSPVLGKRMYAIRKKDLKSFTPNSKSVCGIHDGSTNAYLREDRAIEEFLKTIEPNYNWAIERLGDGSVDTNCIYTIAGFIAFVITCSPGGMRVRSDPLKNIVEVTANAMDTKGLIPPPPPELGGTSLSELLHKGAVNITIDKKYPQAIGIASILESTAAFGNFKWEILRNGFADSPFFTSDYPVAIEKSDDPRVLNRIVPLTPNLAIRIRPDVAIDINKTDFTFTNFGYRARDIRHNELVYLNRLIVRCAEDTVFYRDDRPWVQHFVAKNRHYRIEPFTHKLPTPNGTLLISTQRIARNALYEQGTSP